MTVIDQTLVGNATNAWVNGEAVRASGTFAVVNPATGEPVAEVCLLYTSPSPRD